MIKKMTTEGYMTAFVMSNLPYIIIAMTLMILLALIVFVSINLKLAKLNKRYKQMMQGMDGVNLENLLMQHISEVKKTKEKTEQIGEACKRLDDIRRHCVQHVALVRFNAFEDTGSDLSYALALLDEQKNGVVMSSIYGRNESRVYAKPIVAGKSSYHLTSEEMAAMEQALTKK